MGWLPLTSVRTQSPQTGTPLLLLVMLAIRIDDETGRGHAALSWLARDIRMSERNTQRILNKLVSVGELVIERQPGRKSVYSIPLYPGELGYAPAECHETHACNHHHTPLTINRQKVHIDDMDKRRRALETAQRANREQNKTATNQPQRSTTTARRPGRRDQRQPGEPDALPVPVADDVTPAPAGLVAAIAPGGDAGPEQPTAADILTPEGWLTPDEQQRREAANLAALGLTDADAEEYRANPRDWRAAHGIKPRTGAGHTRTAAQPGRSTPRR